MTSSLDIAARIRAERDGLSRAFRAVADYLISNPTAFIGSPIRELSKVVGVSEPTLIRFSRHFGYKGFPDLRLGVAMSLAADTSISAPVEPNLSDKDLVNHANKRDIAQTALQFTETDTSILMDSGSTVKILAKKLVDAPALTIMTTGIDTMLVLRKSEQHQLMLPGGVLRANAMSLGGRMAESVLSGMSFDTGYFGADSINPEFGISTFNEAEAHLNQAMVKACRRVIVLADASKFRAPALHKICDISQVDILISDQNIDHETRRAITGTGTKLIICGTPTGTAQDVKDC